MLLKIHSFSILFLFFLSHYLISNHFIYVHTNLTNYFSVADAKIIYYY